MDSNHWNNIYDKKSEQEVSWFQEVPKKSLELIASFHLSKDSRIIDIGGGDSRLAEHLLQQGFKHLSVLDISTKALQRHRDRLGEKGGNIDYIVTNIVDFTPLVRYHLWHDRATFHFLTTLQDIEKYLAIASQALDAGGYLIVSTFSKSGPEKCSGLTISQYSEDDLKKLFGRYFQNIKCFEDTHQTPWGAKQDFIYCGFKKLS